MHFYLHTLRDLELRALGKASINVNRHRIVADWPNLAARPCKKKCPALIRFVCFHLALQDFTFFRRSITDVFGNPNCLDRVTYLE